MTKFGPVLFLVVLSMIFAIGAVIFGAALQSVDYEASNGTGNMTATTNTTMTWYSVSMAWWGGAAFLMVIIAVATVFFLFVK